MISRGGFEVVMTSKRSLKMLLVRCVGFDCGMKDRAVAGPNGHEGGRRGHQPIGILKVLGRAIAVFTPAKSLAARDREGGATRRDNRAVRQRRNRRLQRVQAFTTMIEALVMKRSVHARR